MWVAALVGFLVARAWYADDQCTIAQWKCHAGNVGLATFAWGGILGIVMLLLALVALLSEAMHDRRARR